MLRCLRQMQRSSFREEIEGLKLGLDVSKAQDERASREEMEGMRLGVQIAQNKEGK